MYMGESATNVSVVVKSSVLNADDPTSAKYFVDITRWFY
jgi:hypothetical protein